MHYPFVAVPARSPHWPLPALFVTTRAVVNSTDADRAIRRGRREKNCMTSRRTAICLIAMSISMGISAIASIGSAAAQDYPTRPVKWVVGYPPGGATDIIARLIGQRLSERLGQQFVIENKPGAGNNIATESVINADPDGYTVLLVNPGQLHQRHALRQPEIQRRSRHRAGGGVQPRAQCDDGQQGRAGQDGRRVHRLCEGRSRPR